MAFYTIRPLCLFLLVAAPYFVHASGTVTNCTESALRAALRGGGAVMLSCDGVIALTNTIIIGKDTLLEATGRGASISASAGTNSLRLFWVLPGVRLTLRNVTLSGGRLVAADGVDGEDGEPANGAAILNDQGFVILESCTLSDHSLIGGNGAVGVAPGQSGGDGGQGAGAAIYNYGGQLVITNTTFSGNSAVGGAGGLGAGGLPGGNGSSGGRGGRGGAGSGAAIFNLANGTVAIYDSQFVSNRVTGALAGTGGAPGGGLGFPGEHGKSGSALGAAICNESGTITVLNSSFVGNSALGAPGINGNAASVAPEGGEGSDGGSAQGAGIFNAEGTVSITNCSFVENAVAGGEGGEGGAGGTGGFGGNGGDGGDGGQALGGGIASAVRGATQIVNCSFSDNSAFGGVGGLGGTAGGLGRRGDQGDRGLEAGAAVYNGGGTLMLRNSILAHSVSGGNAGGSITDEGFNLSSDASANLSALGSRNSIDPWLGSFVRNGGLAPTLTLSSNSPAINAITAPGGNGCPGFDQRNYVRVEPCDIGAFEFNGTPLRPMLRAEFRTNAVLVTWPVSSGDFVLQSTTVLSKPNVWITLTNQPSTVGSERTVAIPASNRNTFLRLMKP